MVARETVEMALKWEPAYLLSGLPQSLHTCCGKYMLRRQETECHLLVKILKVKALSEEGDRLMADIHLRVKAVLAREKQQRNLIGWFYSFGSRVFLSFLAIFLVLSALFETPVFKP